MRNMDSKKRILVSACLLGKPCRYDGKSKPCQGVIALSDKYDFIEVCPEVAGGLPTPRTPSERVNDSVVMCDGKDVTVNYKRGAEFALELCREKSIDIAILKAKSPSCGKGQIYDGTFTGRLIRGNGVTAEMLIDNGIKVFTENELELIK